MVCIDAIFLQFAACTTAAKTIREINLAGTLWLEGIQETPVGKLGTITELW